MSVPTDSISYVSAVTASDTAVLDPPTRGLYLGTGGTVYVDFVNGGTNIAVKNLLGGMWHPMRVKRVYATGLVAADILGGY